MLSPAELAQKREEERKSIEESKVKCRRTLELMRDAVPAEVERLKILLNELIKDNPKLPPDFKQKARDRLRLHECNANMRATDKALHMAAFMAKNDRRPERTRFIGEARVYLRKAMSCGAERHFQMNADRTIEAIMLTGGVEHKGPTRAKPASTAPVNPHNAKA